MSGRLILICELMNRNRILIVFVFQQILWKISSFKTIILSRLDGWFSFVNLGTRIDGRESNSCSFCIWTYWFEKSPLYICFWKKCLHSFWVVWTADLNLWTSALELMYGNRILVVFVFEHIDLKNRFFISVFDSFWWIDEQESNSYRFCVPTNFMKNIFV